jgi:hypothetical protein
MRTFLSAVLMAAALMPFGLRPASAQVGEVLSELMVQCRRDAAELCPDVEPGGGRIAACLYSRLNDLSPPCHRAMRDGIAVRACKSDYNRFCGDVQIGQGQVARCLREFRDEVSPRCAEALAFSRPPRYGDRRWDDQLAKAMPYARKYTEETYTRKYREEPDLDDNDDRGPDDLK